MVTAFMADHTNDWWSWPTGACEHLRAMFQGIGAEHQGW